MFVAGTEAATTVVPILAGQLTSLIHQLATVSTEVDALVEAHPESAACLSRRLAAPRPSRAYSDRKRAQGKRHHRAIIDLARRRTDVLFAMLREGTLDRDLTEL